ncbi:MAG: hypothetical protein CME65_05290 [Halobacteriovoraceae bacterium]|nr:hypothetical protein [Halobacteriovoraceae bacterium]|tara:strand:- start:2627 stop:3490 length:864 start_codon:yes stop_codon:yes gene_type:complete
MERDYLLIVDKDEDLRQQLVSELSDLVSMVIIQAADGVQAYQKTRNQKFKVVLTDFDLPKISGAQLIAALRETNHNAHTPIIFYTDNLEQAKNETRGSKHIEYLSKPQSYELISKKINELSKIDPNKKRFKLDVDFINPFIDSSMKTLNGLCGVTNITAKKPYLLKEENIDIDISGTLAITSPYFRGNIAISFEENVYKTIVGKMLEENVAELDPDNEDGAAEIINIIFGQTKAVLNTRGYSLDRAIPSVIRGKGHKVYKDSKIPILLVPFESDLGDFWIQICVKAI